MRLLVFDTETTGLMDRKKGFNKYYSVKSTEYYDKCRLVEIGWRILEGKDTKSMSEVSRTSMLVKPNGYDVQSGSGFAFHNITQKECMEQGHDIGDVLKKFREACNGCDFIIAHNILFDLIVIDSENYRETGDSIFFNMPCQFFCTMRGKSTSKYKPPKLSMLYKQLYNAEMVDAHRVDGDLDATVACLKKIDLKQNKKGLLSRQEYESRENA